MHQSASLAPTLIALDWGTTALRAFLLGSGGVMLDTRAEAWGVMRLPGGGFPAAFQSIAAGWPGVPAIAAGMVGSAQGWVQAPYRSCPAGIEEIAESLAPVPGHDLRIVPGLRVDGDRPDVMRGEETQVVGAIALHPALGSRSRVVLPGTHSKWARVVDGRVDGFTTYLTGELFGVLRDHSILGRPAREAAAAPSPEEAEDAFARGVAAAREAATGVAPLLFATRALVLTGRLHAESSLEYLSGVLIGDEVRAGLAEGDPPAALVGGLALCRRYAAALALFGVAPPLVIEDSAPAGLWRVAAAAGLIDTASGLRPA